jgi:hypothetical protein
MRTLGEIQSPHCKITVMAWNQKYLVKLEHDSLEQTYKISEFDVMGDEGIKKLIDEEFINSAMERFSEMRASLDKSLRKVS